MSDYQSLTFEFADFQREISAIKAMSEGFLDGPSTLIFDELKGVIANLQTQQSDQGISWQVREARPLRTIVTNEYEPGKKGGAHKAIGELSWCWNIRVVPVKKGRPLKFEICGNASIKLRIRTNDASGQELALWRVECGSSDSPGCYFHTQVGGESEVPPFPSSLSVPRFPTLFVTPMSVIEFFLGELFQERWHQHVVGNQKHQGDWNNIQKNRLEKICDWNLKQIRNCQGSPWIGLKHAKPSTNDAMFVERK